ncbi:MAG TPA: efflux RND transporter periplasmic adaptor subunit [Terriglobales bacterium]|nr:efflux RND transporter periplasmic adaptor subunit [Terriglobales bacterium]
MGEERPRELRQDLTALRLDRSSSSGRGRRRRWPWLLAALPLLAAGAYFALARGPVAVNTATATRERPGEVPLLSGSGYIVTAEQYVSIGVRVAGRIDRYFVEEGQHVKAGDPLVQLDDRDYRAAVARTEAGLALARANAELARAELRRGQALRQDRVLSVQEYDVLINKAAVAAATVAQLEAELQQARISLDYTTLRAPTDGVVLAKLKEVGEIAVPGGFEGSGDLIRIANLSELRAEVDINETDLPRIHLGQASVVTPDAYPEARYQAEVAKLYPQVDRQKGTLKVEVRVLDPDEKLLPDMSARVSFLRDDRNGKGGPPGILVPAEAVQRSADSYYVWRVREGQVEQVAVETNGSAAGKMRITRGLAEGDVVVVGEVELRAGQPVAAAARVAQAR